MSSPEPERAADAPQPTRDPIARGFAAALAAYLSWGALPIYYKALHWVPPFELLAHRVVWSMVFLALLVTFQRRWRELGPAVSGRRLAPYLASTIFLSANWLIFIWAVNSGRILEASLGYFINPLVNVLFGVTLLRERLTWRQGVAVVLAGLGVFALVVRAGVFPWVSIVLAFSFGSYGLVRKKAAMDAVVGLFIETALLTPLSLLYLVLLAARGQGSFGASAATTALLTAAGAFTAVPLIWFALGVRSLRLSTMGLLQYIAPTGQFLLAVGLYREPFTGAHAVAFGFIWASLALYSWDALRPRSP